MIIRNREFTSYSDYLSAKFEKCSAKRLAIEYNRMQILKQENFGTQMLAETTQNTILWMLKNKDKKFKAEFRKYLGESYE